MEDAAAVIILRQGTDIGRALSLLGPMGLARLDHSLVEKALRAVHPDPMVPAVFVATRAGQQGPGEVPQEDLTPRERDMLELIAAGLSNQEIADELYLSLNSIKSYIRAAYRKIGVSSRSRAVIWWYEHAPSQDRSMADPSAASGAAAITAG